MHHLMNPFQRNLKGIFIMFDIETTPNHAYDTIFLARMFQLPKLGRQLIFIGQFCLFQIIVT
jgi:hypothetical protein